MSHTALARLLKSLFAAVLILGIAGASYFMLARKPKIAISAAAQAAEPLPSPAGAGENATPQPLPAAVAKSPEISAALAPAPAALPAADASPAATPPAPRKAPELFTGDRPDLLLAKRTERRFAKLGEWAAKLAAKKAALKTPLQIEAFNEEAQKYHAELAEARAEAATQR